MTNEALVSCIREGEDAAENMLKLWQQNQGLIRKIAARYKAYDEMEDLTQQGYIGLCSAVEAYDPKEGVPFVNYAALWIRHSIRRYVDNCSGVVRLPGRLRNELYYLRRFTGSFEQETGRTPSEREICLYMGWSLKQLHEVQKNAKMGQIGSLDAPVLGIETEDLTLADIVADDAELEAEVVERLDEESLRSILWSMVAGLPGKCPAVVRLRYQEDATFKEIGECLGVREEAARRMEGKALRELRKPSRKAKLRPFLSDEQEVIAYRTGGAAVFHCTWTSSTERAALR